jgi:PadR family transcriptional regulator, regulatory protein PadR
MSTQTTTPAETSIREETAIRDAGHLASDRDEQGNPIHHGWPPCGGRRRWMAPFVLALLTEGPGHGYALTARLQDMGVSEREVDVGQVYKTLRCLEGLGHVRSHWSTDATGPRRRDYVLTEEGERALDEWAAIMTERTRLIGEFDARYLRWKER